MEALIGHLPRTHTQLYSDLSNNLSKRIPFDTKPEESSIVNRIILMQKAGCKAAIFCSKNTCSDNPPTAGWYNILYWGMASEQIILASCTWQPKTTYYGVFNLDETAPTITWREVVTKSDLDAVKAKQINRYVSAEKNTDTVLSSYENKEGNFILQFTSNDTTGTIPTLTGSHLFIIEHFMVGDNSDSAIERAYSAKGKLIAWRFKQWWNKTWTAWENS